MPYIRQAKRDKYDGAIDVLLTTLSTTDAEPGELNYVITRLVSETCERNYGGINAAVGVLECAKIELYRRLAAEYEDEKVIANGDLPGYKPWWTLDAAGSNKGAPANRGGEVRTSDEGGIV